MTDPVFVIHGVGNRDQNAFESKVASLQSVTGNRWDMKAVYWGDLGADDRWVDLTVPRVGNLDGTEAHGLSELRDGRELRVDPEVQVADLAATLLSLPAAHAQADVRDATVGSQFQTDIVAAAAVRRLNTGSSGDEEIRDEGQADPGQAAAVREAIAENWMSTAWLSQVADSRLLEEIGGAITAPLADPAVTIASGDEKEVRDGELRGIAEFVKHRITDLDRVVGATLDSVVGRLNSYLRTEQGPGVTRFLGDVLVYQRHQREIHDRIRDTIDQVDPGLGRSPDRPVRIIGHSLGGVIAVDMATADTPLWTRCLVTFGSQSPFFHVCDPRGGQLKPYANGALVQLPPSLASWTNLWEPLDLLAFIAARVFRLHDGSAPRDVSIGHLVSSGLWTHSAYWDLQQVAVMIQQALESA